jgi:broad specificity phosphatase PhoE
MSSSSTGFWFPNLKNRLKIMYRFKPILLKNIALMRRFLLFVCLFISLTACSQTYYIVRHAEKATVTQGSDMMANDPPLSDAGKARAQALKEVLKDKKIAYIYSTNTIRTRTTAEPLSQLTGVAIQTYGPKPDSAFIQQLKSLNKNVLIVGHSNTVDDIVNMLCNEQKVPADLQDNEYDNLFIVTKKKGKMKFEQKKF